MNLSTPLYSVWSYTPADRSFWSEHLQTWVPKRIFDAHTHVQEPDCRLHPMTEEKRRQHWVNEVLEPIGASDAARCQALVFPDRQVNCLAFGIPDLDYDLEAGNARLQAECVRRGWYRLAVVRPQWPAGRVARELDQPRTLGVKVYYSLIGDDSTTRDKYLEASIFDFLPHHQLELLNDRRAWVTLHVPRAGRLGHPDNLREIQEIRRRYPDVTLVIAHLGRCYTMFHAEQALPRLADDAGLYFDLSAVFNPEVLRLALEQFGTSRLLYGTDNPVFYMRGRQRWRGTSYINHTNYPFFYNQEREPYEIESHYTLYIYEALLAIKQACEAVSLDRGQVGALFSGNARELIDRISSTPKRRT
jgi:predicted TIM-barrel fold metal-dependent hydrolase